MARPLTKRQQSVVNEFSATGPRLDFATTLSNLMWTYGASRASTKIVLKSIDTDKRGIKGEDYKDFLLAFFPIRDESERRFATGYTMTELANIVRAPWWLGDISPSDFNRVLKATRNTSFVRRSASNRSSFVIGFDTGTGPQFWIHRQEDHRIVGRTKTHRTLSEFYYAWSRDVKVKTLGSETRTVGEDIPRVEAFEKPTTGEMIEASTEIEYVRVGELLSF